MPGPTEKYLLEKIKTNGSIHITLIDPEKVSAEQAARIAENSSEKRNCSHNDWRLNICFSRTP